MVGLELGRGGKNLSALIGLPPAAGKTVLCNGNGLMQFIQQNRFRRKNREVIRHLDIASVQLQ